MRSVGYVLAVLAVVAVFLIGDTYLDANDLRGSLVAIGYKDVQKVGFFSNQVTAEVRGCKIGFDRDDVKGRRTIKNRSIEAYNVSVVSRDGTWTRIHLNNAAPTPTELAAYMSAHRTTFPCYK